MYFPIPQSLRFPLLLSFVLFGLLGRIDTAQAQGQDNLLVTPSSNTFYATLGGGLQQTVIQVNSSAGALSFSVATQLTSAAATNWLSATASQTTTPTQVVVVANPANLPVGTYSAEVILTPFGASTTSVIVPIYLVISSGSTLSLSPSTFTFTGTAGSTTATAPQALNVSSATNGASFTESVTYSPSSVPNWLTVSPTTGVTPAALALIANPTGLAIGTYTATVTISSALSSPQTATVTFNVATAPTLISSMPSIPFLYQIGQSTSFDSPATLTISTANNSAVPITLSTTTSSCPGFFQVSQTTGLTTPATVTVFQNLQGITQPTTCSGSITVTPSTSLVAPITIPVTLTVSTSPLLLVTPPTPFTFQLGGALPANQNLTISSTTAGLAFTASSNVPWLAVTSSGNTSSNSQLSLSLVASQLANLIPNTYQASVTVNAPGAANSPLTVPVSLTVSASSMLSNPSPSSVTFAYEIGQQVSLNSQLLQIGTTGGQIPFTVSVPSTTGTQFIMVSPTIATAPAAVTLTANPGSLAAGTYQTAITVTPTSGGASLTIPVQLIISNPGQPQLNVSTQTLSFALTQGTNPGSVNPQSVQLTSPDPNNIPITITSVVPNASWLVTNFVAGITTPQTLVVSLNPTLATILQPQVTPYTTNLTITGTTSSGFTSTATIQVSLLYTSGLTLTASPSALNFTQAASGATPAAQSLNIGVSGTTGSTLAYSVTTSTVGGNWLSVTPTSGSAPGTISVGLTSFAASLSPGTYTGSVIIFGSGAANTNGNLTVPVTLTVTPASTLTVSPAGLTFAANAGGSSPASQNLAVSAQGAIGSVSFTTNVVTASGGNWLSVAGPNGTPSTLVVTAVLGSLAQGAYTGTITLTPSGGGSPTTVPVSFNVGAQVLPSAATVVNAASGATGAISPGELVTIYGSALGPVSPQSLTLNAQGNVTTTLGGVTVSFNGVAAPLTYVSATQINCVVPFEIASASTAQMQVSYNGVTSGATALTIQPATPGIFTQNSSGSGLGAILLPNYSTVSASNAAPRGSTVIIYGTGGGQTTPASVTGGVAGATLLKTNGTVTVTIGGIAATVTYAGAAPGLVEGVLQINAIVPTTIGTGTQPIVVTIGNSTSQNGVTLPVQ